MANKTVSLYQSVKIKGEWTFRKTPSSRLKRLPEGGHYLSWYEGSEKHMNPLGPEPDVALAAFQTKARELVFIAAGGELKKDQDCNRQ